MTSETLFRPQINLRKYKYYNVPPLPDRRDSRQNFLHHEYRKVLDDRRCHVFGESDPNIRFEITPTTTITWSSLMTAMSETRR